MTALARVHGWAAAVWLTLASAAGLGFVARDLLAFEPPAVALAWVAGAALGARWARQGGSGAGRRG